MYKILLINPSPGLIKSDRFSRIFLTPVLPIGLAYIAALLRKYDFAVKILDQYANNITIEEILELIKKEKPDIVGFSCLTPAMGTVREIVRQIRYLNQNITVVLGNTHATVFADELLRERIADVVVRGEGELSMLEIASALHKKDKLDDIRGISFSSNGNIYHNPPREPVQNLDVLSYPAWDLLPFKQYRKYPLLCLYDTVIPIQASRGCLYNCVFCAQDALFKKLRYRKIESVLDEIEYLHNTFKIKYFGFVDSCFPFSLEYGLRFCDGLMKRGLHKKIRWITEIRVDLVNPELLRKMKEAGLYLIMYGFEVGNQKILNTIGKGTTLKQAKEAMKETKKTDILTLGFFMLGLPGETLETCKETIEFAKELDCDIAKFNLVVPYPGSGIFETYKARFGKIKNEESFTSFYGWFSNSYESIFVPDGMDGRDLLHMQKKAMFEFYARPKLVARHLLKKTISFSYMFYGAYIVLTSYLKSLMKKSFPAI